MEPANCSQLKEILALSLRNDFYKDDIWNLITNSKVDHKKFEVRYFVKTENDKVIGFIITTERKYFSNICSSTKSIVEKALVKKC